jgi:hypothetical protein
MPDRRIRIYVAACPFNHTVLMGAFDERETSLDAGKERIKALVEEKIRCRQMQPWCGICGGSELTIHVGMHHYDSMDDAYVELLRLEREQLEAARAERQVKWTQ